MTRRGGGNHWKKRSQISRGKEGEIIYIKKRKKRSRYNTANNNNNNKNRSVSLEDIERGDCRGEENCLNIVNEKSGRKVTC